MINKDEVFNFLDMVRESGKINMFGASIYITQAFGTSRKESMKLLTEWMETFDKRHARSE